MAQSVGEVSLDIVAGKNNIGSVVKSSMSECQDVVNKGSSGIGGALGKIGSVAGGIAKGVAVGVGVASTAVIGLGKQAVDAYGNFEDIYYTQAGCTVSCHCGPSTLGVLFVRK